jgi:serine/threonine-protein kinase
MSDPVRGDEPTARAVLPPSGASRPGHPVEIAGRYRIVSRIGDGGMGVVYKAEHVLSKKKLAIKLLYPHLTHGAQAVERFKREVSAAAEIDHPGIVQVFDAGVDSDGSFYMAMELLDGESLASVMKRDWPGTRRSLELILELCEPLSRAHAKGFIHRDLKPDNVFLARDPETGVERLKLLDFGLARDLGKKGTTESGVTFGTPEYMAPEQSMSAKSAGTASDVWSVGVMLYELLSGFHPFEGETPNAIMVAAIKDPHLPLRDRAPHVPASICEVVERTLIKNVPLRVATAGALADQLHAAIDACGTLDDQRPATTHRMAELAEAEDEGAADMSGIPAADDAAISLAQRRAPAEKATPTDAPLPRSRAPMAIGAAAVAIVSLVVTGWLWLGSRTPPTTSTPLAVPVPPTTVVVAEPPPTTAIAEPPLTIGLDPPTTIAEPPPEPRPPSTARPRAPSIALTTLSPEDSARARDCLAHNDFACATEIYRRSRDPRDLGRVIDALEHVGRHREALSTMRDFVRRFPSARETSGYRAQLAAAGM